MDELKLIMNKDGVFEQYKEPYMTIEVPTEEDFRWLEDAVREKKKRNKGCEYCTNFEFSAKILRSDFGEIKFEIVTAEPLPGLNLTTGEKIPPAEPAYAAMLFETDSAYGTDFLRIRCCPMCGKVLIETEAPHGK